LVVERFPVLFPLKQPSLPRLRNGFASSYSARLVIRRWRVAAATNEAVRCERHRENLASCRKNVRMKWTPKPWSDVLRPITKEFQSKPPSRLPPGKAPVAMVLKKHEADIGTNVKRKLSLRTIARPWRAEALHYPLA